MCERVGVGGGDSSAAFQCPKKIPVILQRLGIFVLAKFTLASCAVNLVLCQIGRKLARGSVDKQVRGCCQLS